MPGLQVSSTWLVATEVVKVSGRVVREPLTGEFQVADVLPPPFEAARAPLTVDVPCENTLTVAIAKYRLPGRPAMSTMLVSTLAA